MCAAQPDVRAITNSGVNIAVGTPIMWYDTALNQSRLGFRDECLNEHWFVSMRHARQLIEEWRIEYNTERPHSSLGYLTPVQFAQGSKQKEFLTSDSTCVSH